MPINRGGGLRGSGIGPASRPQDRFGRNRPFRSKNFSTSPATIHGVTRDSAGVAIGAVDVRVFRASDHAFQGLTTSDAAGNFAFWCAAVGPFYVVAYKVGAPDLAGTTVTTLYPTNG